MLYTNENDRLKAEIYILEKENARLKEQTKIMRKTLDDYREREESITEKYWTLKEQLNALQSEQ